MGTVDQPFALSNCRSIPSRGSDEPHILPDLNDFGHVRPINFDFAERTINFPGNALWAGDAVFIRTA